MAKIATKPKKAVKKAPAKKELVIKDGTYVSFMTDDVQMVGVFESPTYCNSYIEFIPLNGLEDVVVDLPYDHHFDEDETFCTVQEILDDNDYINDLKIITKAEATKLAKTISSQIFDTGNWLAIPCLINGKTPGFRFGCGKVKLTIQEVSDYLSIRKKLIEPDLSKEKGYSNFNKISNLIYSEEEEVRDDDVLELCKKFKIK